MPVYACDRCQRYFIFDRESTGAEKCPRCSESMRSTTAEEAAEFARHASPEAVVHEPRDEPA